MQDLQQSGACPSGRDRNVSQPHMAGCGFGSSLVQGTIERNCQQRTLSMQCPLQQ